MLIGPSVFVYEPSGKLAALSNYWCEEFWLDGYSWPSVEHYYQASKFLDEADRRRIMSINSPAEAKRITWEEMRSSVRHDWAAVRIEVMRKALVAKMSQSQNARSQLCETWPFPIFEDSMEDRLWGIGDDGRGENRLGATLGSIRAEILQIFDTELISRFAQRPKNGSESRYGSAQFSEFSWTKSREALSTLALRETPLVTLSIDSLFRTELVRKGLVVPDDLDVFPAETTVDSIAATLQGANSTMDLMEIRERCLSARASVFDRKYADYLWNDDVRSVVPNWCDRFWELFFASLRGSSGFSNAIVVGAGSGEEAKRLWAQFGQHVTLVDVGCRLVRNCQMQAPRSMVYCAPAESLVCILDEIHDVYCSLRTFESMLFDDKAALSEAWRVLKPNGLLFLSVSDAYLGANGLPVRGRLVEDGVVSRFEALADLIHLAAMATEVGFSEISFASFGTELVISARKA